MQTTEPEAGLRLADSVGTNWSVLCETDKVNRPIKVNTHLEHGPCVSNANRLSGRIY